jgi:ATP-dependent DNA helicase RecG
VSTLDGFKIAEADLELRGPGEVFGVRQSGIPEFRVANIARDQKLIESSRNLLARLRSKAGKYAGDYEKIEDYLEKTTLPKLEHVSGG